MNKENQISRNNQSPNAKSSGLDFLIFSFVLMVILLLTVLRPLIPNDFFPYLRIGEEIFHLGKIPTTEFMTYTQYGSPASYPYWFSSILFLEIYKLGGVTLTSVFTLICIGGFYSLLWLALKDLNISSASSGLILIFTGLIGALFFVTRPQILAFPLFGLAIYIILRWQKKEYRYLWVLPIIAFLWANIHGSFIILFILLISASIFGLGDRKRLILFAIISLFATLINYYGFELWVNIFSVVGNSTNQLFGVEWGPPVNRGWQFTLYFIGILFIPLFTAYSKTKVNLLYWVWFIGFGWMSLQSVRYIFWFLPFEAIILSLLLNPIVEKLTVNSTRFQRRSFNLIIGICLLLLPLTLLPNFRSGRLAQDYPALDKGTPIAAALWLKNNPHLPDNLWSNFNYSTYLTYALPDRKLFSSNRIEDLSIAQVEDYFQISAAKYDFQSILAKYNINIVLASSDQDPDLDKALSSSNAWSEIYRDQQAVIFLRRQP